MMKKFLSLFTSPDSAAPVADEAAGDADDRAAVGQKVNLETMGRLAGGVAHDFNNSLMVLLNCIEMMRTVEDSVRRQTLLADMESAAKGAQSTAQQLMSLSKEGSTPGQPSDPRAALRSIASNLRRMLPENIMVQDLLRGTPPVTLVSGEFEQTILSICLDAKDAMPEGGALTLRCHQDPTEPLVLIEVENSTDKIESALSAMNKESLVYQTVVKVGGQIDVKRVDESVCVTLTLPVTEKQAVVESEEYELPRSEESQKLLLLDDNELVVTMLSRRLEQAGYEVISSLSVAEALELTRTETFDALVCDAVLPDGTPKPVIETFLERSKGPAVLCSGYARTDPILSDLEANADVFLQKPFSTDDLIAQLSETERAA